MGSHVPTAITTGIDTLTLIDSKATNHHLCPSTIRTEPRVEPLAAVLSQLDVEQMISRGYLQQCILFGRDADLMPSQHVHTVQYIQST